MIEVWPVIHALDSAQTDACASIAEKCGCAGVFVIVMNGDDDLADRCAERMLADSPRALKVGVNYLSLRAPEAYARAAARGYDAVWTDRQMFTRGELSNDARALIAMAQFSKVLPADRVFVAVAFKGQEPDPFPGDSASLAAHYGLVPTTSGPWTGVAPNVDKIVRLRAGLNNYGIVGREHFRPLAIASGVTPANVENFARAGVTHILVNTGISRDFHYFDEAKLAALMAEVRAFRGGGK